METASQPRLVFAQVILMAIMDGSLSSEACLLVTRVCQALLQTIGSPTCMSTILELFRGTYSAYKISNRPGFTMPTATHELPQTSHPSAGIPAQSFAAIINDTYRQWIQESMASVLASVEVLVRKSDALWPARYRLPVQRLICNSIRDAQIQLQNLQLVLQGAEAPNCPQLTPPFEENSPRTPTLWGE
eukprot:s6743_g1.t1